MAITTIRTTYALDAETVSRLEWLARQWDVSKSEALRRAIRAAAARPKASAQVDALDQLQGSLQLSPRQAAAWARGARLERRRSSAGRESRR